ncbi:MAG: glycosyltransferase [Calditrichaeota bacterium]|nr:glycosyltransferase [Calditrichota bacterium]
MKILIITNMFPNSILPTSGIGLYQAVKHLRKLGHEFRVIYTASKLPFPLNLSKKRNRTEQPDFPRRENYDGIQIDFIPFNFVFKIVKPPYWGKLLWFQTKKQLTRIAEDFSPDLIWSQTAIPNGWAASKLSEKFNIPHTVMVHGSDLNSVVHLPHARKQIRAVYEKAGSVIVLSERLRKEALDVAPNSTLKLVHFGVDMEMMASAFTKRLKWLEIEKSDENITVLSVCRVIETKGIQYNIEVMKRLKDIYPGLRYINIGEGELREEFEKRVIDSELQGRMIFTGRKSFEATKIDMAQADIYSMPSYQEGLGLVYLESMALGIPTIAVRGQGGDDLIEGDVNGFLVDAHDVDQLTLIWKRLITDRNLRDRIGNAGKKTIQDKFTWDICSRKLESAFQETIAEYKNIE